MPDGRHDWRKEASRKLADAKFPPLEREEVTREISGYLEDLCDDARGCGFDDAAAVERASAELHEDKMLGAKLYRARKENPMYLNDRTKRLWLPGVSMLLASAGLLAILQLAGFSASFPQFWAAKFGAGDPWTRYSFFIYVPWLCALPFVGAAGAYWSRRVGSGPGLRLAVGLFPVIVFLSIFVVFVPAALAIGTLPPAKIFVPALAGQILSWVVIPGAALLFGVLPFLASRGATQEPA